MNADDARQRRLEWERADHWPHRDCSSFVTLPDTTWHVQSFGTAGPWVLLLHGTGASTHSFRSLAPLLAQDHRVLVPDLPGHGFSARLPDAQTHLPGMAAALAALLQDLDVRPSCAVGHSAGAAILARMQLDGQLDVDTLVSLNGALLPLDGLAGALFTPLARLFGGSRWLPRLVARRARNPAAVRRLVAQTGSSIDAAGIACYTALLRSEAHVAGTLRMMMDWDLHALARQLPMLGERLLLVCARGDRTLPEGYAGRLTRQLPAARIHWLEDLGHLAHEEAPERIAALLPGCE